MPWTHVLAGAWWMHDTPPLDNDLLLTWRRGDEIVRGVHGVGGELYALANFTRRS